MKAKPGKRTLSLFLALVLCLCLLPAPALAGYDGAFDIYVFDNNAGGNNETVTSLTLDSSGTARFGISLDISATFPDDISYVKMFDSESDTWYTLYENGELKYGASADEFATGFLSVVTIPDMVEGTYLVEAAVKTAGANDLFYISSSEIIVGGGSGPAAPVITTAAIDPAYMGEPYSFSMSGTAVSSWAAAGLPAGLSMSASGQITGTPTAAGSYPVTVTATGAAEVRQTFTLTVAGARSLTVTFSLAGGSGTAPDSVTAPYGTEITLPTAPTRNGYTFAGWSDGAATYLAGASYRITRTATVRAQWNALPGVTVTVPAGLGPVVGSVSLYGTGSDSSSRYLWGRNYRTPTELTEISLSAAALGGNSYGNLSLCAYVDGRETAIAGYTGTVQAGETQAAVALQPSGVSFTVLSGVEVAGGLTEGADYTVGQIRQGAANISPYGLPMLVSVGRTYSVRLGGVQGSPVYTTYNWDAEQSGLTVSDDHKLRLAEPARLAESIALSGTVTWDETGYPAASYVTVQATQEVGGIYRTATACTDGDGRYTLNLFPGAAATFTVLSGGRALYVTSGGSLDSPAADSIQNLTVKSVTLTADVTLRAAEDANRDAVERYLSAMGWTGRLTLQVTANSQTDACTVPSAGLDTDSCVVNLYNTAKAASVDAALSGSIIETVTKNGVAITDGAGTASFTPGLKPGVVAELMAAQTMSVVFAYFDSDDKYLGESAPFTISSYSRDCAATCPVGTKTVALLPGPCAGTLRTDLTLADLTGTEPARECLNIWRLSDQLAAGRIEALSRLEVSREATENGLYITKPNSTLFAGADSFIGAGDLITFTGSIGLDAGLTGGRLNGLSVNPKSGQAGGYINTAPIQALVINGQAYSPENTMTSLGCYSFDFADNGIELPCDFTVYCTPGSIACDMNLTVTAEVTCSGGSRYDCQLIGSAAVSRPGASLDTLSTYACEDRIVVSGTAQRGEKVTIYDDGAVIGTARGDEKWGEWTALVPLCGTDSTLTTVHRLYAVTASGVVSEQRTVIHNSSGPQLKQFTMSWSSYGGSSRNTINMGDAYTFTGSMYDTTFTARFEHPGKLLTKTEWNSKVVFKVYTTDGEIRFLEAAESGDGIFTATVPTVLRSSVTAAEVMYEPDVGINLTTDGSTVRGRIGADDARLIQAAAEDIKTGNSDVPTHSYHVIYDGEGNASVIAENGTAAVTEVTDELKAIAENYRNQGLDIAFAKVDENYDTPIEQWLALSAADASLLNWHALYLSDYASASRLYGLSRNYTGGTDTGGNPLTAAQAFDLEKKFFEDMGDKAEHSILLLGDDGDRYDLYTIRYEDASGGEPCPEYSVTAAFTAVSGIYTATVTAAYSPGFCLTHVDEILSAAYPTQKEEKLSSLSANQAPQIILMDAGDPEPVEQVSVAEEKIVYTSYFTENDAARLADLTFMRDEVEGIFDVSLQRELADLEARARRAEEQGDVPSWLNESNFHYNGTYKPESSAGRTAMQSIETSTTYEGYGLGVIGAVTNNTSFGESLGPANVAVTTANIVSNVNNTHSANEELELMRGDMEQIMGSPCYKKLNSTQREIVDKAYEEFMYWYKTAGNHLTGTSTINAAVGAGGVVLGEDPLAGLTFTGATYLNNAVGGKMLENSFGSAIITYNEGFAKIKGILRARSEQLGDPDCKGKPAGSAGPTPSDGDKKQNKTGNDPSGIVYEGVLENPVEGAAVTLYYAVDSFGAMVKEGGDAPAQLKPADDVRTLIPNQAVQITGEDGRYQWGVPAGLWYVTAEYGGLSGSSGADAAATVAVSGLTVDGQSVTKLLPVLPVQLDVNIPLVDESAPVVEDVRYTADGIYVTFSKYMADSGAGASVLDSANYSLTLAATGEELSVASAESAEQGHAPSNIDPYETTYTRTVLLRTAEELAPGAEAALTVRRRVESYAGTPMEDDYTCVICDTGLTARLNGAGDSLTYQYAFPADGSTAYVIAAGYDARGKLLGATVRQVSCSGFSSGTIAVPEGADVYRLFVLDSAHRPMTDAWTSAGT